MKEPSGFPGYNRSTFHYDAFLELKPWTGSRAAGLTAPARRRFLTVRPALPIPDVKAG